MIVVIKMTNGKHVEDEFGCFEDEVLNAEWQPPCPELQLGLQEAVAPRAAPADFDVEAYLERIYRVQE